MAFEKYPWLCPTTGYDYGGCSNSATNNIVSENEANNAEAYTTDAYGTYGLKLVYYPVSLNINKDDIYGEDTTQVIERSFYFNGYTEQIPPNVRTYQLQGIWGEDVITLYVGRTAFKYWSTYGGTAKNMPEVHESMEPRIGDVVYFPANDTFYEIRDVKYYSESFGLASHTYTITLKVYKDTKYTINIHEETLQNTEDPIYQVAPHDPKDQFPIKDPLALNDDFDNLKTSENAKLSDVLWDDKNDGRPRIDPFDGWK